MVTFDSGVALLPPLAIAVPIAVGCVLLAVGRHLPRAALDLAGIAAAVFDIVLLVVVLVHSANGRVVTWSARWEPRHRFSVGIVLVSDPIGVGIALLAAVLVLLALIYSWRYFDDVDAHYHVLMLLFLAGMAGFALTGDLFDMFVFFELMGAAAYALTGYKVEDPTAVQGALNFGIVNSLGAYISLIGITLLYARVGNLTLPQLSEGLAHHQPDALLVAAFVAVSTGFLVKAAMAPFHFWLADAHGVAPTPVCVLFSGVMVPLGAYGVFRVYWEVFARVLPPGDVRRTFVVLGAITAIVGAVMCLGQRHIKRLLAYSTIAHVGLFLAAAGTLSESGTAGAAMYVVGHAGVKCALFLLAGVLLNAYGTVDELQLFAAARGRWLLLVLFTIGGLGLAGLPPFGTALGKAVGEEAGWHLGYVWMPALFVAVSAATGGAVLRVAGRVFLGWGDLPDEHEDSSVTGDEDRETSLGRLPLTMLVPVLLLLAGALSMGVIPGVHRAAADAAAVFTDPAGYASEALTGRLAPSAPQLHVGNWTAAGVLLGLLSAALAVAIAAAALFGRRLRLADRLHRGGSAVMRPLRQVHSGLVTDYVAWLLTGVAVLAAFIAFPRR